MSMASVLRKERIGHLGQQTDFSSFDSMSDEKLSEKYGMVAMTIHKAREFRLENSHHHIAIR